MTTKTFWIGRFLIVATMVCIAGTGRSADDYALREVSERNELKVLEKLRSVIQSSGKTMRIYYRGLPCKTHENEARYAAIPFPSLQLQPASKNKSTLASVREIFAKNPSVTVTEQPSGVIRVKIGDVPTEILHTRISHLSLDDDARYNKFLAIQILFSAPEVKAASHSLGVAPLGTLGGLLASPTNGAPHLPASFSNVTVDQVLDIIAKAFDGFVVYSACGEPTYGEKKFWAE
jgi:hypothetical protein